MAKKTTVIRPEDVRITIKPPEVGDPIAVQPLASARLRGVQTIEVSLLPANAGVLDVTRRGGQS